MEETTTLIDISKLKKFIGENRLKIFLILLIYLIVTITIGLTDYPYIDDIGRQLQGYSGFSEHYSRYLSEYSARLIQGSRHLTDLGLTSNILSAFILTGVSTLVLYIFLGHTKISWVSVISSTIIGLNPWFLEALSFRFDSPYLSLSILVTIVPFLFWNSKLPIFFISSSLGIFLMCNSYQASSGIYILMTLTLVFLELYSGKLFKTILPKIFVSMGSFIFGLLLYLIQIRIFPPVFSEAANLGKLTDIPSNMVTNTKEYLTNIYDQSTRVWLFLTVIILALFILKYIINSKINKMKIVSYLFIYLILGAILSYGVYIIFPETFALMRPRYEYGMGVFLSFIMILTTHTIFDKKIFNMNKVFVGLLCYYLLSFSFIYASSLTQQKEIFISQSNILAGSLNQYIDENNRVVKMNRFLPNSPIYDNSTINYPILTSLIMPNTNISWDMTMRFNAITKLQVDFQPFIPEEINFEEEDLLTSTILYNIYDYDNEIYVVMK